MNNLPVVFSLRVGEAKGGIHVALAQNVGDAKMVALYHHIVFFVYLAIITGNKFLGTAGETNRKNNRSKA